MTEQVDDAAPHPWCVDEPAVVDATLVSFDGTRMPGRLDSVEPGDARLTWEQADRDEGIPLHTVRRVEWRLHNASRKDCEPFVLVWRDGMTVRGTGQTVRADAAGIYLYVEESGGAQQWFVPHASLQSVEFGAQTAMAAPVVEPVKVELSKGVVVLSRPEDYLKYLNAYAQSAPDSAFAPWLRDPGDLRVQLGAGEDTERAISQAQRFGLPLVVFGEQAIRPEVLGLIPPRLARRHKVVPLESHRNYLLVAADDPASTEVLNALDFLTNHRVVLAVAQWRGLRAAQARAYDRNEDREIMRQLGLDRGRALDEEGVTREAERLSAEQPIVRLVGEMLAEAASRRASDIHLRPTEHEVEALYRIDGLLVVVRRFHRALLPALIGRLKVLGGMNIAERRIPQDGRTTFHLEDGTAIDLRLSVVPTIHGESIVIRLLDTRQSLREIESLGMLPADERRLREMLARSQGLLLATGPTGSGKTTTLYAALLEVRKQGPNILTIEDPVEYHVDGVQQVQVNRAAGLTFARALRNFLRHDPDVIMVGEIRDSETGSIAVESALTGHLVLSTLHTNTAATTVTRLLDLGVAPFLLQSTLLGVFAQRLVRRNCPHCLVVETPPDYMRESLGVAADEVFMRGSGCARCDGLGVHGRMVTYELMTVSPAIRQQIVAGADADRIHRIALSEGMNSLTQHALGLARSRLITLAEAYRVRTD